MHPLILHELAKVKLAEELEYAERQRRFRTANQLGTRPIDFGRLVARVRVIVAFGRPNEPARAGA
jgi:hypothetical protein